MNNFIYNKSPSPKWILLMLKSIFHAQLEMRGRHSPGKERGWAEVLTIVVQIYLSHEQ